MSDKSISHDGVVDSLQDNEVVVRIVNFTACDACHARGACIMTEENEKYIHVHTNPSGFETGEKVRVILVQSLGFRALFLGYVLPFLLVLTLLLIMSATGSSELVAGITSLSILVPYYIGLKIFRSKLDRQFSFVIQKI